VRIRRARAEEGRKDLQVAATLEPRRSILRSYLGKAWSETRDAARAEKELRLAQKLDANDPTPWLYSAILAEQQNKVNEAIDDLEHSQELNDNRSLFRSRLLLDQDKAIRSANLARIYQDAGRSTGSARASRPSATTTGIRAPVPANSYEGLRDPKQINRYEARRWPSISSPTSGARSHAVGHGFAAGIPRGCSSAIHRHRLEHEYFSSGDWIPGAQYGTSVRLTGRSRRPTAPKTASASTTIWSGRITRSKSASRSRRRTRFTSRPSA
jgi:hypothetical protein